MITVARRILNFREGKRNIICFEYENKCVYWVEIVAVVKVVYYVYCCIELKTY